MRREKLRLAGRYRNRFWVDLDLKDLPVKENIRLCGVPMAHSAWSVDLAASSKHISAVVGFSELVRLMKPVRLTYPQIHFVAFV